MDAGETWEVIVRNTPHDGSYTWTIPHLQSDEIMVKVAITDLAVELASDVSAPFSVWFYEEDNSDYWDEERLGTTPRDEVDGIKAGDYIMLAGSDMVYYVDQDMKRRPFFDMQTYYTYEDSLDAVVQVSQNTLAKFRIGAPMLPQAGVVLVKIQSVAKVYMTEETRTGEIALRWVLTEEIAQEMFGEAWAAYVLDVDPTLFTRYMQREHIDEAYPVDVSSMKMREHLHE